MCRHVDPQQSCPPETELRGSSFPIRIIKDPDNGAKVVKCRQPELLILSVEEIAREQMIEEDMEQTS